jgi:hypothetical protein
MRQPQGHSPFSKAPPPKVSMPPKIVPLPVEPSLQQWGTFHIQTKTGNKDNSNKWKDISCS